jgi:glyoxylase-like metal-dependent hydrolase (beta-lactamase superfamily II)
LRPGISEKLSPRITRLIAPNPGPFTYTGSGTYVIDAGRGVVVIDPGPDHRGHIAHLVEAAGKPVLAILVTHSHRDHCGGVELLKRKTDAPSIAFAPHPTAKGEGPPALDEGGDHDFVPDDMAKDGDTLVFGDLELEAVHTPGHIGNHLCFALPEENVLFTGDHIMGWATTVVAPPDGNMTEYMASLEKLLERSDRRYYPTHGAPIDEPLRFVEAVRTHRFRRDREILECLERSPRTIPRIVDEVYQGLAEGLKTAAGLNVRAHLDAHEECGRVTRDGDGSYRLS